MKQRDIANKIYKSDKNIFLIYAFNGTGKTRLSREYNNITKDADGVHTGVYYNAFSEDIFAWDNDENNDNTNMRLNIVPSKLNIYFQDIKEDDVRQKLDLFSPKYNFYFNADDPERGIDSISFYSKEDEAKDLETGVETKKPIKISRGEERIFIWCFFITLFDIINEVDVTKIDDKEATRIKEINYFFIDDPVSSLDDINMYATAEMLFDLFDRCVKNNKKVIVTTHHLGLFSVLCDWLYKGDNSEKYKERKCTSESDNNNGCRTTKLILNEVDKFAIWIMEYKSNEYCLKTRNNGAWLYHLLLLKRLNEDAKSDNLYRFHFGLLRQVLEITASFLGRNRRIGYVLALLEEDEDVVNRINENSHKQTFDYQDGKLIGDNKELIIRVLDKLIRKFDFDI